MRIGGGAALAAPALMWGDFLTMGTLRHGYNLLLGAASNLATRGTPNSDLYTVGFFFIPGLLTLVVAAGLWSAVKESRTWRLGVGLVVVAALFLILTGYFRQDPSSPGENSLHGLVSQICFGGATLAMVALALGAPSGRRPLPPRRLWLGVAAAVMLIEGFNLFLRGPLGISYGLFQRPFTLTLSVWFVITGIWLLREREPGSQPAVI